MTKKPNMKTPPIINDSAIYQTQNGAITLKQDVSSDMLWASQAHIADIFEIERSVVTKHIRNILKNKELDENSVRAKLAHTAEDGKSYQVQFYSLDVILAVGYRTNSKKAIAFRQWATKTLKEHIHKGFTINRTRLQKNYTDFLKSVDEVKALLPRERPLIFLASNVQKTASLVSLAMLCNLFQERTSTPVSKKKQPTSCISLSKIIHL